MKGVASSSSSISQLLSPSFNFPNSFPSLPFPSSRLQHSLPSFLVPLYISHTHTPKKKTTSAPANKSCQALSQRHSPRRPQHRPVQLKAVGLLLLICRGVVVVAIGLYHHSTIKTIDNIDAVSVSISIISINTIAVDADALCSD